MERQSHCSRDMTSMTSTKAKRTYRRCVRCEGTGIWTCLDRGGTCFGCNGSGQRLNWTKELELEAKRDHLAEVQGLVADLETATPARFPSVNRQRAEHLVKRRAQLVELEAEVVALQRGGVS